MGDWLEYLRKAAHEDMKALALKFRIEAVSRRNDRPLSTKFIKYKEYERE